MVTDQICDTIICMTPEIEKHLSANMSLSKKDIMIHNFIGGLCWGLGTVIGATVVLSALGWSLNALGLFDFLNTLSPQVQGWHY